VPDQELLVERVLGDEALFQVLVAVEPLPRGQTQCRRDARLQRVEEAQVFRLRPGPRWPGPAGHTEHQRAALPVHADDAGGPQVQDTTEGCQRLVPAEAARSGGVQGANEFVLQSRIVRVRCYGRPAAHVTLYRDETPRQDT
jgi:hypothetical protein